MYEKAKRKNDEPGAFPRWILLIALGFALGVIITLALSMSRSGVVTTYTSLDDDALFMTATSIIQGATGTAQAISNGGAPVGDAFLTVTAAP